MPFDYVSHTVAGPSFDAELLESTLEGCDCDGLCSAQTCSCIVGDSDNYTEDGLLEQGKGSDISPLLECHDSCSCVATGCKNRIVQFGVKMALEVRESGRKGVGLFTKEGVERGRFVCEYAGEMIGREEVEKRREEEGRERRHNYVLTVKEHFAESSSTWFIDPSRRGNLGRFINHSCNPNLDVVPLRIGSIAPVVGLFTNRAIESGEELCYDYGESILVEGEGGEGRKECLCGSEECRRFLPLSNTASE